MARVSASVSLAAAVLFAFGSQALAQTAPAAPATETAQTQPRPLRGNARAGQLTCNVAGGVAFVFGSTRDLTCVFLPVNGPPERYTGEIRRFGVDLGFTGPGVIVWDVVSVGALAPGSLAGTYAGVAANVSAGLVGLGADALIGGSNRQVALQPLAFETASGLNVAAGVAELTLKAAN